MKKSVKKHTKHKDIINFIKVIRESFKDASIVYQWGGCYGFYTLIKYMFPEVIAYFVDEDEEHILCNINGRFYDVMGEYPYNTKKSYKLKQKDHEIWSAKASGQRIEFMLAKYNRMCKLHSEDK